MDGKCFRSRNLTPEGFEKEFYSTLTPGLIPADEFIKWDEVSKAAAEYADVAEFLSNVEPVNFVKEVADTLLASDIPEHYLRGMFMMLGHTADELALKESLLSVTDVGAAAKLGDEKKCLWAASILSTLGLHRIVGENLQSLVKGVRIGLDTHRRKNIGGRAFQQLVGVVLQEADEQATRDTGVAVSLTTECKFANEEGDEKRCDFGITAGGELRIAVEANFYSVSGSKPTEIRRAYANLRQWLRASGKDIIWVTDGKGYYQMRSSLLDAFRLFPNIYNLNTLRKHIASDIQGFLEK